MKQVESEVMEDGVAWQDEMALVLEFYHGAFSLSDFLDREDGWEWYGVARTVQRALVKVRKFRQSEAEQERKQQQQRGRR